MRLIEEIIVDIPNGAKLFSKQLRNTDKNYQLICPTKVLQHFPIQNGHYQREFTAVDGNGVQWDFVLAVRQTGEYDKPFLRPTKWHEFVMVHGLYGDDADYGVVFYINNEGRMQVRGLRKCPYLLFGHPAWHQV